MEQDEKLLKSTINNSKTGFSHGDEFHGELLANFSSNVWFGANHNQLYAHLFKKMNAIRRYPEADSGSLRNMLAERLNISANELLLTNGSAEGIYMLAQAYRGKRSLIVSPTFSEYERACRVNEHEVLTCTASDIVNAIKREQPDLVWICTPNNPDGKVLDAGYIEALMAHFQQVHFVLDLSFREYSLLKQPEESLIQRYSNVYILYSFTKRYGIPGLRIGYLCSCNLNISKLFHYVIPWSVNVLAAETLKFLLNESEDNFRLPEWLVERNRLMSMINQIPNLQCHESDTPFFLVTLSEGKSADLKSFLLERKILVRDASTFSDGKKQQLRLLTLTPEKNNLLIEKLKEWSLLISL